MCLEKQTRRQRRRAEAFNSKVHLPTGSRAQENVFDANSSLRVLARLSQESLIPMSQNSTARRGSGLDVEFCLHVCTHSKHTDKILVSSAQDGLELDARTIVLVLLDLRAIESREQVGKKRARFASRFESRRLLRLKRFSGRAAIRVGSGGKGSALNARRVLASRQYCVANESSEAPCASYEQLDSAELDRTRWHHVFATRTQDAIARVADERAHLVQSTKEYAQNSTELVVRGLDASNS